MNSSSPEITDFSSSTKPEDKREEFFPCVDSVGKSKRKRFNSSSSSSSITSSSCSSPSTCRLPQNVSEWNRSHADSYAGIVYSKNYTVGHIEGLKTYIHGQIAEFTQKQKDYMEFLDEHVTFNLKEQFLCHESLYKAYVEPAFFSVVEELRQYDETSICVQIRNFIKVLNKVYDSKLISDSMSDCIRKCLPEGLLVRLVGCFAELCDLSVDYCNEADVVEFDLHGTNVESRPDLRLYNQQINARGPVALISVVEVDKGLSANYELEIDVHDNTLGRHAGELLLDLHRRYARKKANDYEDDQKISMMGMIAVGTNVYMTVLEMTWKHYQNLKCQRELEPNDKATVYYSDPLDILALERNLLMRDFMTLNNIEYI